MDAIYLKLDGIEGESLTKGFEKQIRLIAYNHSQAKWESGEARGTYIGGLTLTKPIDLATPGLYEHYRNGKTVKEGVLTLCRNDKGAMQPFIILYAHQCADFTHEQSWPYRRQRHGNRGFGL
ncbi:Hemolysin-coregulated protein (uncharacterized) [Salmonella enterica subsp. arizonae]|uniref:Hemolysin-coregulated protein (Uncharacterized) n=1 Tax=Salmonella enterica subsp. arizonae TaxID=59203 RepID=A0A379S8Q5_SALER|nr:Hemolysin-coregulated protein (uncharacterized) [Salmonella enterica subsp. arizonae]